MKIAIRTFESQGFEESDALSQEFEPIRDPSRVRRFVASDDTIDRYGEVVLPRGANFSNYSKNPVIQGFHDYGMWPIGKAVSGEVRDNKVLLDIEFDPASVDEEADKVLAKIDHGTIKTGSIGFLPSKSIAPGDKNNEVEKELFAKYPGVRRIFVDWELLEYSIVPIPANPNAVLQALQKSALQRFGSVSDSSGMDTATEVPEPELTERDYEILEERLKVLVNNYG